MLHSTMELVKKSTIENQLFKKWHVSMGPPVLHVPIMSKYLVQHNSNINIGLIIMFVPCVGSGILLVL